jgi:sialic acid synthase SpsE
MRLILDVGSGASLPDAATARRFVDEVAKRDGHKHEIILKAQLFVDAPPNIPLDWAVFEELYVYARDKGYHCTSSVFDTRSLAFLLGYKIPFVKLACRPDLYWLAGEVPRKVPVYVSDANADHGFGGHGYEKWVNEDNGKDIVLECVRRYPSPLPYYRRFPYHFHVSDHTVGWGFLHSVPQVYIWEKHLRLPDSTGPDAGPWSVTPDELAEVIS